MGMILRILSSGEVNLVHKYIVQVLSVIIHPMFGDVMLFPWRKHTSGSNFTHLIYPNLSKPLTISTSLFQSSKVLKSNSSL